jgi:hypothetical protein
MIPINSNIVNNLALLFRHEPKSHGTALACCTLSSRISAGEGPLDAKIYQRMLRDYVSGVSIGALVFRPKNICIKRVDMFVSNAG